MCQIAKNPKALWVKFVANVMISSTIPLRLSAYRTGKVGSGVQETPEINGLKPSTT